MSSNEVRMTESRFKELESHEIMLGKIASEVEDYCEDGNTTTYEAVLAMKLELLQLKADTLAEQAESVKARLKYRKELCQYVEMRRQK